jgi:O-antigen ligase
MRYNGRAEQVRYAVLIVLLAGCFLMGGASRLDVMSLILLQPLAAACAAAFLLLPGTRDWQPVRTPLLLLAALATVMVAQLIPLPPAIWTNLPGHGAFTQSAVAAGLPQPWRPISLTPDLTLASLVGLLVPLAVLLGFACINSRQRGTLLTVLVVGSAVSALFGLAQASSGLNSPFYLYDITNRGSAVGLFSNRNHQAVLIAMTWPMLAAWAAAPHRDPRRRAAIRWIAGGFALFLLPLLLVTGSRAGLVLGVVALIAAGLVWRASRKAEGTKSRFERFLLPSIAVLGMVVLLATVVLSRAEAIQRMLNLTASEDTRVQATPVVMDMARDFFPVGSGFGSFDPIFRFYEPASMLDTKYLNHAHNDVLELAITAGLPGLALALLFVAWAVQHAVSAWRSKDVWLEASLARVASLMIILPLASSVVDYPLRTPLVMALVAIACGWLGSFTNKGVGDIAQSPPANLLYRQAVYN